MKRWARWLEGRGIQALAALLLALGLPACSTRAAYFDQYRQDLVLLKQICEQYNAGERTYHSVEGVEGIFQMTPVNPSPDWQSQLGMDFPANHVFDSDTPNLFGHSLGGNRDMYWFYEQQPPWGSPKDAQYRRTILAKTEKKPSKVELENGWRYLDSEGFVVDVLQIRTSKLISKYGWIAEDLTTPEMRKHWISGARLKIVELSNNSIIAERIDFYRATGPIVQMAWAPGVNCGHPSSGYDATKFSSGGVSDFIRKVLRPTTARPSAPQLEELRRN